ncbi:MAG: hypothetical protein H7Z14_16385 [Anaerolineae bacterium]|nr:hypothetical protein [Phycisphaerae bacterium]
MSAFTRFLIRAHRRRIAWRLIEHAAIGLLIGCVVASMLLVVSWWRQDESLGPVVAVLFVASIAGIVASFWRRPTLIDSARVIETQLNSPELFSSAMLATSHADQTFVEALQALANARVAGLTPATLILRRYGSRTWSGVGLATAGVIVMALMLSTSATDRQAIARSADPVDAWTTDRVNPQLPKASSGLASTDQTPQRDPNSSNSSMNLGAEPSQDTSSKGPARSSNDPSGASAGSRGVGSANSESRVSSPDLRAANSTAPNTGTLAATGAGAASNSGLAGANDSGAVSSSTNSPVAPWTTERWSSDREAALDAVRTGAVPDSYRSLVQDYFQRP